MLHPTEHGFSSSVVTTSAPEQPKSTPARKAPRIAETQEASATVRVVAQRIAPSVMDSTSGYPSGIVRHIEAMLKSHRDQGREGAVIAIALENINMVMSGYGSELTEQVIQSLEEEIATLLGERDAIARLQKDIIIVTLAHTSQEECQYLCGRIRTLIQSYGSRSSVATLHLMALVTPVIFNTQYSKAADTIDAAYIALKEHRGMVTPAATSAGAATAEFSRQEMGLANYLNRAIHEDRLRLAYQPIIDSATGIVSHYEALLRVVGDDGTISSAGALIPIAERMGLIHVIDRLVLEKVYKELDRCPSLHLSFNVSNLTTGDTSWLDDLKRLVGNRTDITHRMVVEITETAAHRDLSKTAYFVAAIQSLGAQVALDDFGSGYTSFRQLKTLSVDFVKIDGAFIRDLVDNADNRFFVKTLLDFTKGFGLKAVAEFVESGEVAKMLMELGVEYMQGYYFGRPYNHRVWLKEDQ